MHPSSLANLKPWPKGVSGNPGGRPKGSSVTAHLLRMLAANDGQLAERIAEIIIERALQGDFKFAKEVVDRADGTIAQRVAGHDGRPVLKQVGFNLERL